MKRTPLILCSVLVLALILNACKKYEEGPAISFRSRYDRVVNNWQPEVVLQDGNDYTYYYENFSIDFGQDGQFVITDINESDSTVNATGFWDLVNDDDSLRLLYDDPAISPDREFWKILRLTEDELWVQLMADTNLREVRFIPVGGED